MRRFGFGVALAVGLGMGLVAIPAVSATQELPPTGSITVINAWPADTALTVTEGQASTTVPYLAFAAVPIGSSSSISVRSTEGEPIDLQTPAVAPGATVVIGPASVDGRTAAVQVLTDTMPTPNGVAALRVVNAAPDLAAAAVDIDGQTLHTSPGLLESSGYQMFNPGSHLVNVLLVGGGSSSGTTVRSLSVDLAAGSIYTVLMRGFGDQAVGLDLHLDAVGLTRLPSGFVPTDTPAPPHGRSTMALLAVAALIVLITAASCWRAKTRVGRWIATLVMVAIFSSCQSTGAKSAAPVAGSPGTQPTGSSGPSAPGPGVPAGASNSDQVTSLELPADATALTKIQFVNLGLAADGLMDVPDGPTQVGWYVNGPLPGQPGPAVLAAHVSWAGHLGVFGELDRLQPGDLVQVGVGSRMITFEVYRAAIYDKNRFPTDAVYTPTADAELRLISCTGPLVQRTQPPEQGLVHADNIVIFLRKV